MCKNSKNILLSAVLAAALCFFVCSEQNAEQTETIPDIVTTLSETTIITGNEIESEAEDGLSESPAANAEDVTKTEDYGMRNSEMGFVYFIQPMIEQYDEYDEWNLAVWECRDTDVLRGCHYNGEWKYRKELIFVFSNYTDKPVTVDSIQIIRESDGALMSFADGSNVLDIDFTVQPGHKTDYLLRAEDFDYSACESGIYNAIVNVGLEGYGREFFINNSELYEETVPLLWYRTEQIGIAPTFLTEEQKMFFAKAHVRMSEFFWCDSCLSAWYAEKHTADEFIEMFTDVFTEDYAWSLARSRYIDENGSLRESLGGRGIDMSYYGHCFFPGSSDDEQVTFKAVVTYCHSDNPYEVWFEEKDYHMVNTENGWRVDKFSLWN
ncbi:MAG: hypothetical protein HFJ89_04585 [Oscillospiraceae bacterium]|jgi:hypothetical protein|nr:hypothetical protein [Oscillospiraceae bacterium]